MSNSYFIFEIDNVVYSSFAINALFIINTLFSNFVDHVSLYWQRVVYSKQSTFMDIAS